MTAHFNRQAVAALPRAQWEEVLRQRQIDSDKAKAIAKIKQITPDPNALRGGHSGANADLEDKLDAWHKRLEARVADLERSDAHMGKTEAARWAKELEQFREEFS